MIRFVSGDLRLTILSAGTLWLDGGAMFGVVPKTLWAKLRPPDERNRIRLGMNVLLVEDGREAHADRQRRGHEVGRQAAGDLRLRRCKSPEELLGAGGADARGHRRRARFAPALRSRGRKHRARCRTGGSCRRFPNARYVVQKGEIEFARSDNERIRASYIRDNFEPVAEAGMFDFVDGDARVDDRIERALGAGAHAVPPRSGGPDGGAHDRVSRGSRADGEPRPVPLHHGLRPRAARARSSPRSGFSAARRARAGASSSSTTTTCPLGVLDDDRGQAARRPVRGGGLTWRRSSRSRTDGCFAGARSARPASAPARSCSTPSMTGYQEILSDPSYRGQIVVMTSPEIGNVGTNADDTESGAPAGRRVRRSGAVAVRRRTGARPRRCTST